MHWEIFVSQVLKALNLVTWSACSTTGCYYRDDKEINQHVLTKQTSQCSLMQLMEQSSFNNYNPMKQCERQETNVTLILRLFQRGSELS